MYSQTIYNSDFPNRYPESRLSVVRAVFSALQTDYGSTFTAQFSKGEVRPFVWKCRLLELSEGFSDEVIINAVDELCHRSPEFPPNLQQIYAEMRRLRNDELKATTPQYPVTNKVNPDLIREFNDAMKKRDERRNSLMVIDPVAYWANIYQLEAMRGVPLRGWGPKWTGPGGFLLPGRGEAERDGTVEDGPWGRNVSASRFDEQVAA